MKKLLLLIAFVLLFPIKTAFANFSDQEPVPANSASTGWWVIPTVAVTAPNGGEKLVPGSTYLITWTAASTDPAATVSIDISYSLNGGTSYTSIITGHANDGSALWTLPGSTSFTAKIKVTATDSHGLTNFDESDAVFTIANPPVTTLKVNGKDVSEKINPAWTTGGAVTDLGGGVTRVGTESPSGSGNDYPANFISQTISNNVKNIFFSYDFYSYDYSNFDSPGFRVTANSQTVFELWAEDVNPGDLALHSSGWQNFSFDPSIFSDPTITLTFMAGNSDPNGALGGSADLQSWVYLKDITTATISANLATVFSATTTSGVPVVNAVAPTVTYYSVDPALPPETPKTATYYLSPGPLPAIADLSDAAATSNTITLTWTSNGGVAYDLNYGSTRVTPWPTPRPNGQEMETVVSGLAPDTNYCFTVKSVDDTPQWSAASNTVCVKTLALPPVANLHDVIINEVMWMGSTSSTADEWIELKNTTGSAIDLTGWKIERAGEGGSTVDLSGSIPAGSYFLLSNYVTSGSAVSDTITADLVTTALSLDNFGAQLTLKASDDTVVDETPSGAWPAGLNGADKKSMERNDDPTTGWHTCINLNCNKTAYWDAEGNNYGTPRQANLSLNDKSSQEFRQLVVDTVASQAAVTLSQSDKNITFKVINLYDITKLSYQLTYDTDNAPQGAIGDSEIVPGQTEFTRDILLGTCSICGTCVYQTGVKNVKLSLTLTDKNNIETKLDKSL